MRKLTAYIVMGLMAVFMIAPVVSLASPAPSVSAACDTRFLGMPTWYRGITESDCSIQMPSGGADELGGFIWKIVLNIVEMALVLVVYVAVGLIIYSGFLFITGGGNPGTVEKARKSVLNAVIGLVIALSAIALTNFIFRIVT